MLCSILYSKGEIQVNESLQLSKGNVTYINLLPFHGEKFNHTVKLSYNIGWVVHCLPKKLRVQEKPSKDSGRATKTAILLLGLL